MQMFLWCQKHIVSWSVQSLARKFTTRSMWERYTCSRQSLNQDNVRSWRYCRRLRRSWHDTIPRVSPTQRESNRHDLLYKATLSMTTPTLCQLLLPSIMTNAESLVRCVTRIGGILLLERVMKLLEKRKTRRLPVWNVRIMMWSWRTPTKEFLQRPIRKPCCFQRIFTVDLSWFLFQALRL